MLARPWSNGRSKRFGSRAEQGPHPPTLCGEMSALSANHCGAWVLSPHILGSEECPPLGVLREDVWPQHVPAPQEVTALITPRNPALRLVRSLLHAVVALARKERGGALITPRRCRSTRAGPVQGDPPLFNVGALITPRRDMGAIFGCGASTERRDRVKDPPFPGPPVCEGVS